MSSYIIAVNDYFISHPIYKKYENKFVNLYDFNNVKSLDFKGLKFSSNEFQIIKNKYPRLLSINTRNCTIYKEALVGCLTCNYYDQSSDIMSLDSFNGFSGKCISLDRSHILHMNKNILHLNTLLMKLRGIHFNYEHFFLTTSAPNLRKIEIHTKPVLNDKDLLFVSGLYNLESVQIMAILSSYEQLQKLERLRELRYVFCSDENELEATKRKRRNIYEKLVTSNANEEQLKNYLMMKRMLIQNKYQDLQHKLYVPRLERVKWENKISTKELEKIREELLFISNLSLENRKNISREEKKEYTIFETMYGLNFDYHFDDNEEEVLIDSRPFEDGGNSVLYLKKKTDIRKIISNIKKNTFFNYSIIRT